MNKILTLIIVLLLLVGCSSKPKIEENTTTDNTVTTNEPATEENKTEETKPVETQPAVTVEMTPEMEEFKKIIDDAMMEQFEDYSSYYAEDGTFNLEICAEGLIDELMSALDGKQEYIDSWNGMVDSLVDSSKSLSETAASYNIPNPVVAINILNDANRDNILFRAVNGVIDYNALTDSE